MLDTEMLLPGESVDDSVSEAVGHVSSRGYGGHSAGVACPQDLDQLTKNDHACRALWSAVVIRAVKDLLRIGSDDNQIKKYGHNIQYHRYASAKAWFESESREPRSFWWVCQYLGLNAGAIRSALCTQERDKIKARSRLLYVLGTEGGRGNHLQ